MRRYRRSTILLLKRLMFLWIVSTTSLLITIFSPNGWPENNSSPNMNASKARIIDGEQYDLVAFTTKDITKQAKNNETKKAFVAYSPIKPLNGSLLRSEQKYVVHNRLSREPLYAKNVSKKVDPRSSYPSLYSLYSEGNVKSGLSYSGRQFQLNGINIRILSGSINYFRVHPTYWRDRLKKLRALGFNTVETYVPWNVHEQKAGQYNFVGGWANVRKFIEIAKEEDLLVILRPGPYICSQWDFGGLPSFLLRKDMIKYRSLDPSFLVPAKKYLKAFSRALVDLQWSHKYGAQPIIMIQLENDFNITSSNIEKDKEYILRLKIAMEEEGLTEVQYVVANKIAFIEPNKIVPGVLQTVKVVNAVAHALNVLKTIQPHKPMMVMEYWTGMYDRWFDKKDEQASINSVFIKSFVGILLSGASVNLYMFHGGSNFGFLGGGSHIKNESVPTPTTTSFDFDAPISESGAYTRKYWLLRRVVAGIPSDPPYKVEDPPKATPARQYSTTIISYYIPFEDIIKSLPISVPQKNPRHMEALNINQNNGQGYGFILYRKTSLKLTPGAVLSVTGVVRDILYIIIDGKMITKPIKGPTQFMDHGYWMSRNPEFLLPGDGETHQLDLLVENVARFDTRDLNNQRKGIRGSVYLNDELLTNWQVFPLEFKKLWLETSLRWRPFVPESPISAPAFFKGILTIEPNAIHDTFINAMKENSPWTKGQVFANGFNLGRYWNVGPTKTLYLPGPFLKTGENEIIFFELFQPGKYIHFEESSILN